MKNELKMNTIYQVDIRKVTKAIDLQVAREKDIMIGNFQTIRKFLVGEEHGYTWTDAIGEMYICYELPAGWRLFAGFNIEDGSKYHVLRRRFGGDFLENVDTFELLEEHAYVEVGKNEMLVKNSKGSVRAIQTNIIEFLMEHGNCQEVG